MISPVFFRRVLPFLVAALVVIGGAQAEDTSKQGVAPGAGNDGEEAADVFRRATELRIGKEYEKALELLDEAERKYSANPEKGNEAAYQRGLILEETRRHDEALAAYETAFNRAPGTLSAPYALMGWARVSEKMGRLEEAAGAWDQVIRNYPRFGAVGLFRRGLLEERLSRPLDALDTYRTLMRGYPRAPEAERARKDVDAICARLTEAEISSTSLRETIARGLCLMEAGRLKEAERLYSAALRRRSLAEEKIDLLMSLGSCFEAQGEFARAKRAYRRAAKVLPGSAQEMSARMAIVQLHLDRNRLGDAIKELGRIVKRYPGSEHAAQAQYQIGSCFELLQEWKKAEKAYRKVLEMAPQSEWSFRAQQMMMRMMEMGR